MLSIRIIVLNAWLGCILLKIQIQMINILMDCGKFEKKRHIVIRGEVDAINWIQRPFNQVLQLIFGKLDIGSDDMISKHTKSYGFVLFLMSYVSILEQIASDFANTLPYQRFFTIPEALTCIQPCTQLRNALMAPHNPISTHIHRRYHHMWRRN